MLDCGHPDGPDGRIIVERGGMSLRDWFAGLAMQGLIQKLNPRVNQDHESAAPIPASYCGIEGGDSADRMASDSYWIADAMLAERAES